MNSPATSATGLRAYRRAIVACFVFQQEISRRAVWDFFDSIDPRQKSTDLWRPLFRSMPRGDQVGPSRFGTGPSVRHGRRPGRYRSHAKRPFWPCDRSSIRPQRSSSASSPGADKQGRSCLLRVFGKRGCPNDCARGHLRGDRIGAPAASWCDPAGESPAQVRCSVRLVVNVAWSLATAVAKRTQQLHGVWD